MDVDWEDQKRINEFSKLNARLEANVEAAKKMAGEMEDLDDVETEIELVDEDEKLLYTMGDTFVYLPQSEVMERLEKAKEDLSEKIEANKTQKKEMEDRMAELKKILYKRFGDNINLERE